MNVVLEKAEEVRMINKTLATAIEKGNSHKLAASHYQKGAIIVLGGA